MPSGSRLRASVKPLPDDRLLPVWPGSPALLAAAMAERLADDAPGPADLLEYPRHKLKGLLLEEGSAASHAAIVARALGIPCVGRLQGLRDRLSEGDLVIVDGETGEAYLRPRPDMLAAVQSRMLVRSARQAEFTKLRDVAAVTLDGTRITVLTNAGLAVAAAFAATPAAAKPMHSEAMTNKPQPLKIAILAMGGDGGGVLADWIVDMGPEGGSRGGEVVATGTPEQVAKNKKSFTGEFLKEMLG